MSVSGVLARGRAAALQLMRDTCLVERKTGRTFDIATGKYTDVWTAVYSGACRVRSHTGAGRDTTTAETEITLHRYDVRLPWNASPQIGREDRLTVTASDDGWLIGRPLEVVDVEYAGTSTVRRLTVEDRS